MENNEKKQNLVQNNEKSTEIMPNVVWGKVVTYLRQNKETLLQITCGEITDVQFENGVLTAKTFDQFAYERIQRPENIDKIKKALMWQGLTGSFSLILEKNYEEKTDEDLEKLKKMFGIEAELKTEN